MWALTPAERAVTEHTAEPKSSNDVVPEGRRQARAAFLRDFDALYADPKLRGRYVVYHRDRRVAVAKKYRAALDEAYERLKLPADEFLVHHVTTAWAAEEREAKVEDDLDAS